MKNFQIKQKMWSLGGRFTISDELGLPTYQVEGSFFKIPKTFTIYDMQGQVVSQIEKKVWSWLPRFHVILQDGSSFWLKKDLSFFKPHYSIEDLGLEIKGNFWGMNFELLRGGQLIARISQEWFRMTSTYNIEVYDDVYSDLIISLVIAIDYVKAMESSSSNAGARGS
ncbi:LURP-one-related/scramblase family protein [Streptococcus dentapri]|uniref:LURP-one-related/scramblase family protein n=1 Tax=Streptococcus dentapri TaxID=573564 RepID=A0ABV8D0N4_9STRE